MALQGEMSARITEHQQCILLGAKQTHVSCIIQILGHVTQDPVQFFESKFCDIYIQLARDFKKAFDFVNKSEKINQIYFV